MKIIEADNAHLDEWISVRMRLWDDSRDAHVTETQEILDSVYAIAYLLLDDAQLVVGFIEGAVYDRQGHRYGYIEGWYVEPEYRSQGYGGQLLSAVEQWILHQSISLMLSDTIPAQFPLSRKAHLDNGFKEWFNIQVFMKKL
jgi:aminoglycoside 6'-N-acetyltransferase I